MHRIILNPPKGKETDHINMNRLDNRKCNLRICTTQENQLNVYKNKANTSGYKGVYLWKKYNTWRVYIKRKFIGSFRDKKEAARAYNESVTKYYGDFARLNII